MTSKIWLINIVLAVCFVLMGFNAWQVWTGEVPEQKTSVKTEPSPEKADDIRPVRGKTAPESQYSVIAEKNLFDPKRKEELPEEPGGSDVAEKKTGVPVQNIVLYGVILMKDYQKALIQTADAGPDKNRWVTVGETLGTMSVSAIEKERIVLKGEEGTREIFLHEGKRRETGARDVAGKDTPNIINTSASENEKAKSIPSVTPKPETKPAAADSGTDKTPIRNDTLNPVFGGIDRQKQENSAPPAENNNSAPVFGGGGNKDGQKKEEGNTQPPPVMNPFLQLLQKSSGNQ